VSLLVDSARRLRVRPVLRARPQPYCQVCLAPQTRLLPAHDRVSGQTRAVRLCPRCGYVEIPDLEPAAAPPAVGGHRHEAALTRLAADVLGRGDLSVLVARAQTDGERPQLRGVAGVARVDTASIGVDPYPPADLGHGGYDVVVAADVVGQFRDPHVEFGRLFDRLREGGVLVCSTQIYRGGDLSRDRYLFGPGRASYYSAPAIRRIAAPHQMTADIVRPTGPASRGRRRRHVVFAAAIAATDGSAD
jgi:hypothetical protein